MIFYYIISFISGIKTLYNEYSYFKKWSYNQKTLNLAFFSII